MKKIKGLLWIGAVPGYSFHTWICVNWEAKFTLILNMLYFSTKLCLTRSYISLEIHGTSSDLQSMLKCSSHLAAALDWTTIGASGEIMPPNFDLVWSWAHILLYTPSPSPRPELFWSAYLIHSQAEKRFVNVVLWEPVFMMNRMQTNKWSDIRGIPVNSMVSHPKRGGSTDSCLRLDC